MMEATGLSRMALRKNSPTKTAVRPVLPPSPTPAAFFDVEGIAAGIAESTEDCA
jgi:hypothetical protein